MQAWLERAQAGRYREAWEIIVRDNPLPAVHGRVCYHPCETDCNRVEVDEAVSIHAVERFLGDLALAEGWVPPSTGAESGGRVRAHRRGRQQKRATESGYWPLYRYHPSGNGGNGRFTLDSPEPPIPLKDYAYNEIRYRMLSLTNQDEAKRLLRLAEEDVAEKWRVYRDLAQRGGE